MLSDRSGAIAARGYSRARVSVGDWVRGRLGPYALMPVIVVLGFLVIYPLFMVIYGSFVGGPPGTNAAFSAEGYTRTWTDQSALKSLVTTFSLVIPRVVLGTAFAVLLAWLVTRTNVPMRGSLELILWFQVFLPTLPMTLSWLTLFHGKTGMVNRWWMDTFHTSSPLFEIRSFEGIILLSVISMGAFFYFFVGPAFRSMDASMEESARVCGASNLTTLRRITAPLLTPAILGAALLVFLAMLASYEIELLLGSRQGIYVFTTYIWNLMGRTPADYPGAMAMSSVFMLFVAAVIILQFKMWQGRQFITVSGRGFGYRVTDLGRWRWVAFGALIAYFLIASGLPLAVLLMGTFQKMWGNFASPWTLDQWRVALNDPAVTRSFMNTIYLGFLAATLKVVLNGLLSYASLRTRLKGRQIIEVLSWVPRAAPGIVMSVGFVWAVLGGIPGIQFLYGTIFLMAIVITVETIPFGMRIMNAGMVQLSPELEEAARVSGASWLRTMWKVVIPLMIPTIVSGWLLGFLGSIRSLVLLLFIYVPASKVMSIHIFELWGSDRLEQAAVLGLMLTVLCLFVAIVAQYVAHRARQSMEAPVA